MPASFDALGNLARRQPLHPQPEPDVVDHVHVRKQSVVLKHGVDVAPVRGVHRRRTAHSEDVAARRPLESGNHPQARGLAASARPKQRDELPAANLKDTSSTARTSPKALETFRNSRSNSFMRYLPNAIIAPCSLHPRPACAASREARRG